MAYFIYFLIKNSAPMDFIDEIEFYGFVPMAYVNNLIKKITEKTEQMVEKEDPIFKKQMMTALAKNFQIFEVYVLKSVFKFPEYFSFERKMTDFTCDSEIDSLLDELERILEEEEFLKNEINNKERELEVKALESKEYDVLLSCEENFNRVVKRIKEIENTCLETENSYKKLNRQGNAIIKRNQLTEYKELKDAMWEKEKSLLFENLPLSQIIFYNKNI